MANKNDDPEPLKGMESQYPRMGQICIWRLWRNWSCTYLLCTSM